MQDEHSPGSDPSSRDASPISEPSVLETRFDDPASLAEALADSIAGGLRRAVEQRAGRRGDVHGGPDIPQSFQAIPELGIERAESSEYFAGVARNELSECHR